MKNKFNSQASTTRNLVRSPKKMSIIEQQNRQLKNQLRTNQMQMYQLRQQIYKLYQQNLHFKGNSRQRNSSERYFIEQCEKQIQRLRNLVQQLQQNQMQLQSPSNRQEIKDRIILRLEDELLNTKIALREAKLALEEK